MDALKKAEEEKKKAAKRLEQVDTDARVEEPEADNFQKEKEDTGEHVLTEQLTETVKLSLEPMDQKSSEKPVPQIEVATVEAIESEVDPVEIEQKDNEANSQLSIENMDISEDLTMENTASQEVPVQEAFEQTQQAIDLNDTTIIEGLSTENASAPFDDTFHGVLFDEEEESTEVYEETLPGVPAAQLVKDIGGGEFQPTPVAAQTVFSAGKAKKKSGSSWGMFFVLAILALGSFGVFYYFTITPVARKLPSPIVARGIETVPSVGIAEAQFKEPDITTDAIVDAQSKIATVDNTEQAVNDNEIITEVKKDLVDNSEEVNREIVENTSQSEDIAVDSKIVPEVIDADDAEIVLNEPIALQEELVAPVRDENLSGQNNSLLDDTPNLEAIPPGQEQMRISKNTNALKQSAMITEAFSAYQKGQFESAEVLYRNALQDDPDNRDIHLGLAAIAVNKGDKEGAYRYYLKLLETKPDDAFVLSSLISLSNNDDPIKDESIIKTLIHKQGKAPYLYFALGNIHAKQSRWAEAQEAFFNAHSLDSLNPDYALNLAISLDKIGQYPAALDFYKVTIKLAQQSPAKFNLSSVNNRIKTLSEVVDKTL